MEGGMEGGRHGGRHGGREAWGEAGRKGGRQGGAAAECFVSGRFVPCPTTGDALNEGWEPRTTSGRLSTGANSDPQNCTFHPPLHSDTNDIDQKQVTQKAGHWITAPVTATCCQWTARYWWRSLGAVLIFKKRRRKRVTKGGLWGRATPVFLDRICLTWSTVVHVEAEGISTSARVGCTHTTTIPNAVWLALAQCHEAHHLKGRKEVRHHEASVPLAVESDSLHLCILLPPMWS